MKSVRQAVFLFLATALVANAAMWTDNYDRALKQAKEQNKFLLLNFTGSDWCPWCKLLDSEVFSKNKFQAYAKENLICVKLDFPRTFNLPSKTVKQNRALARQHGITGFPSILLLSPDEKLIARTSYKRGGVDPYVEYLEKAIAAYKAGGSNAPVVDEGGESVQASDSLNSEPVDEGAYRIWTSTQGARVEARLEERVGDVVHLRTREDKTLTIRASELSPADRAFLFPPSKR